MLKYLSKSPVNKNYFYSSTSSLPAAGQMRATPAGTLIHLPLFSDQKRPCKLISLQLLTCNISPLTAGESLSSNFSFKLIGNNWRGMRTNASYWGCALMLTRFLASGCCCCFSHLHFIEHMFPISLSLIVRTCGVVAPNGGVGDSFWNERESYSIK